MAGNPQIPAGCGTGCVIRAWAGYPPCVPDSTERSMFDAATRRAVRRRRNVGRLQLPPRAGVAPRVSRCGEEVPCWRILASSGDQAPSLSAYCWATTLADAQGAHVEKLHTKYFVDSAPLVRRLPGARELLEAVAERGWRAVLATSAGEEELAVLRSALDAEDFVCAVTSPPTPSAQSPTPTSSPSRYSVLRPTRPRRYSLVTPFGMCSRPDAPVSRPLRCSAAGSPARRWKRPAPWLSTPVRPRCLRTSTSSVN